MGDGVPLAAVVPLVLDEERPPIWVVMARVHPPVRTVTANLMDVPAYQALGYVVVTRDPFAMDAWHAWRRAYPEAV